MSRNVTESTSKGQTGSLDNKKTICSYFCQIVNAPRRSMQNTRRVQHFSSTVKSLIHPLVQSQMSRLSALRNYCGKPWQRCITFLSFCWIAHFSAVTKLSIAPGTPRACNDACASDRASKAALSAWSWDWSGKKKANIYNTCLYFLKVSPAQHLFVTGPQEPLPPPPVVWWYCGC